MQNDFFSQAHNFQSAATGSVDPRTGLFTYNLLIAQLTGNHHLGPAQTIALAYHPLNTGNRGFGIGFSLGLTQYDRQHRLLSLSTGERYKVDEYADTVYLKQYKQDVVRFEKDVAQNVYRVIHKSGIVEVLTGPDNAYSLKVPTRIINPLGYGLTLDWGRHFGETPGLTAITDDTGRVLLSVEYETGSDTRFTVWPGMTEAYTIQVLFRNDYVTQVKKETPADPPLVWALEYDVDNRFLNRIVSPTGLTEQVHYYARGHRFPDGAPLSYLPYVTRYTQFPGHGPEIVRTYEYTVANFLGHGAQGRWHPDEDYLYGTLSDYQYGSTEHWDNGTSQRHITRRYNQYHLLVSETTEQNGCKRVHQTDYYARTGSPFKAQPPQFQMPKRATVSFNDAAGSEVMQTEFDEAGNPTVQITPDGTRTDWVYYPAGEAAGKDKKGQQDKKGGGCPTSPQGFVRFVKSKTVTPGKASPAGSYEDAPVHQTVYRYETLPTRPGAPCDDAVVCIYQGEYSAGRLLHESRISYVNDVTSQDHGRIQRIDKTKYALPEEAAAGKAWTNTQTFSYALEGEALVKRTRWTGHDQLSLTTRRRQSQVSGKLWHEVDAQQRTARYDYDHLGRLVTQVSNAQTDYSQQVQYAYAIEEAGVATTTKTDVWGSQARVRFDGLGQPYQQARLEKGQEDQGWQLLADTERDSWGRVVSQSHYDWLPREENAGQVSQVAVRQRFEYDDWGNVHRVIRDTGETLRHDYDPVTRTAQITRQAGGLPFSHCTVVYDQRHQPVTTTLYDSQGKQYSQQQSHYDGLGRLRATVDALGQKTEYTYDLLGRVSRIRHSDGTVIQKSYAPFSTGNLVTQIQAGDIILGRREFDSLHRVVSTTRGGRTYHARYLQDSPLPGQITDPLGNIVTHRYEPRLGNALTQTDAAEIQQRFAYDPKTGAMTRARAVQQAARDLHYSAAGRLQQETFRFEDSGAGAARTAGYSYSPGGQLTGYQDVAGNRRQVRFDQYGRPVAAGDPAIDITLAYDAASRVKSWQVHDKQHDRQLTTVVDFDDFGREVRRQIQTAGDTLTLEQRYTVNGQVASRTTRSQQAGLLRQETYEYDPARHWLTVYDCSGAEQPKDAYGVSIARQRFTYDMLGNMLTCTTTLADGSRDTATFAYSVSDPCQLQAVTHTHPHYPATITLAYDGAGRLIRDEAGRRLTYDALGRLAAVHQGETAGTYGYDAADRLVLQQMGTDHTHELYYQGATRVAEILREQGTVTRLLQAHGAPAATVTGAETHLLGTDNHGSVLVNQQGDGTETRYRYSPYGQQAPAEQAAAIPAYNGERLDPVGGGYLLGNGYRAYNPVLMRFNAPDSESPFGAGGLNAYAYCLGDPINRIDPTGHFSWGSIFGIVLGAVGLVVGIALAIPTGGASLSVSGAIIAGLGVIADVTGIASAATEESNPQASAILGWVSLGFGVASLGAAGAIGIANGLQRLGRRLTDAFSEGLSGRGTARINLAPLPRPGSNDYEIAFRHAMSDNRIMQIENPVGSGIYTVGLETNGLLPEGGEVEYLRNALFRPRGDNSTIEIINNITVLGPRTQRPINISNEDFETLYLHFIRDSILNARDINHSVINTVNDFRYMVNSSIAERSEISVERINRMIYVWRMAGFSHFSANEWIYSALRHLSPDLNFPQNITLGNNAFEFFNQNIISDIRNLDVIN